MSGRMRRVNEAVRHVVAEAVGELKDPRIGLVTITGVAVSPDLREGTVYVSVLGNEKKRLAAIEGLESAHAIVQSRVARELRMKRTPHLTFEYDPSVENAARISRLIDEVAPDADDHHD
jgi:ribosome-binding factor A